MPVGVRMEYAKIFNASERLLQELLQKTQHWVASEGDNNSFVSISVAVTKAQADFKDDCKGQDIIWFCHVVFDLGSYSIYMRIYSVL